MNFKQTFGLNLPSKTDAKYIVCEKNVRISVLTSKMFRIEVSKNGAFVDEPTQKIWYRNFSDTKFEIEKSKNSIFIKTKDCELLFNTNSKKVVYVKVDNKKITNFKKGNLKGTYRTLDGTVGPIPLGKGIVSKNGVTVFDDSNSLLLNNDGTIKARSFKEQDYYIFAYGRNYRECIQDFFKLTGEVPLVPRFCLGNWWSRYKAYTQQEYVELMKRFIDEKIPVTVATIDMDWHWVDVKGKLSELPEYADVQKNMWGNGWTGYSWNTDLFPDYKSFLKWLQEKNFKVTVNIHPSDGVRFYEDMYEDMAKYMGIDPATKQQIEFDITNPKYMEAYFKFLHHTYEKDGVDFWWIDWQQGRSSKLKGLDPLWALNHYHYLDNNSSNKRGLILSRYAKVGSHRYPLGFSGDSKVCWNCLKFQPYSTANATNVGYTWWSHDIGGHHQGHKDDELYLRWLQFGVFSPINRLHSTNNEFMGKEPWKYRYDVSKLAVEYLRLRHRLIPYIYSMNYRTYKDGIGLIEPMYYEYPNDENAYSVPNEYLFGSELIVAPITKPVDKHTNLASLKVWLPKGRYTDIFTSRIYEGNQTLEMFRGIENIPVLAKEGAIIPLDMNSTNNTSSNPTDMEVLVYRGNNKFDLYEDDGETKEFKNGKFAITTFSVEEKSDNLTFEIAKANGDKACTCSDRSYQINFKDIVSAKKITVYINDNTVNTQLVDDENVVVKIINVTPGDTIKIILSSITVLKNKDKKEEIIELVSKYQANVFYKLRKFKYLVESQDHAPNVKKYYKKPIDEIINLK